MQRLPYCHILDTSNPFADLFIVILFFDDVYLLTTYTLYWLWYNILIILKFQKTKLKTKKRPRHLKLKYQQVSMLIFIIYKYTNKFFFKNNAIIFGSTSLIIIMFLHLHLCFVPDIIVFGICSLLLLLSSIVFLVGVLILRRWVNTFQFSVLNSIIQNVFFVKSHMKHICILKQWGDINRKWTVWV